MLGTPSFLIRTIYSDRDLFPAFDLRRGGVAAAGIPMSDRRTLLGKVWRRELPVQLGGHTRPAGNLRAASTTAL
jgi:hypothetical protein